MHVPLNARTITAGAILLGWSLGVVAFARREMSRTTADLMAEIALRVAPGATYYAAELNGDHVGFSSTTVDTLAKALQITEYQVAEMPNEGSTRRVTRQTVIRLTRGLALRDFTLTTTRDSTRRKVSGWIVNDSTLAFTIAALGVRRDTQHVKVPAGLVLPLMVPLAVALGAPLKVGAEHIVETFDPEALEHRTIHAKILAESTFLIADSAVYDASRAKWRAAHVDTLTGWRMAIAGSEVPDVWIDELGHPIGWRAEDGLVMRRTAYEIAFENWRMPRTRAADSLARGKASLPLRASARSRISCAPPHDSASSSPTQRRDRRPCP